MKNIFKLLLGLTLFISTVSCRQNRQPYHEVVYNAQGEQMVKVQDYDQNGNLIEYYIAYAMFNQLYNNGGYRSVNHYYYDNRPAFDRSYVNYDRAYQYDTNPRQTYQDQNVAVTEPQKPAYRPSSPKTSNVTYTDSKPTKVTYRPSSPTTSSYTTTKPVTYRPSSPTTTSSYRPSSPSSTTSSYRSSSPSSSYKSSSSYSSSSYRSSSPSSSSSSSYRSSSPSSYSSSSSSSYRSSSPSSYSSSSSSYRSSSPSSSSSYSSSSRR
jgi:hypothetical protein